MKKHIILIEDDEQFQQVISQFLSNEGYRVTTFCSLTSIEELAALGADLFIIDEILPLVSGHIICIMLHSHRVTKFIPQILISGSPMLGNFAELAEVNAILSKPFNVEELLATVRNLADTKMT